ncbi:hypothetical protein CY0110_05914 [Crocosphaera chwakensis CCY0110]|uniref:Transposase Synechocystis PCC 6803 domain-containing protein n=1 Tax=Crocosphaera chwakensis CCY0110 TaxID=391612 RepID=A3ITP6_9CHRO|nr:hypothetical protein CY0110_05914 [Crocosphaera chwakensis CCY0110]
MISKTIPAPYSYDVRKKAIEAVKRGHKKVNVYRLFKVSRNTLDLWLKREKETGDFQAIALTFLCPNFCRLPIPFKNI